MKRIVEAVTTCTSGTPQHSAQQKPNSCIRRCRAYVRWCHLTSHLRQGSFYPGEIGILRVLPGQKPGCFAGPGTKTRLFFSVRDPESQLKQRPGSDQPAQQAARWSSRRGKKQLGTSTGTEMPHVQPAVKIAGFKKFGVFYLQSSDFSLISSPETVLPRIISCSVVATGISIPPNKTNRDSAFVGAPGKKPPPLVLQS